MKEDHDQAVIGDQDVVEIIRRFDIVAGELRQKRHARFSEFRAHQTGHGAADDPRENSEDQIEGADILVVG